MTIYFYSDILRAVERSEHTSVDTLASLLPGVNDIYFEAEEILDQTIDESVWKPYVKAIEVGDIVCNTDTERRLRVLGIHEGYLWVREVSVEWGKPAGYRGFVVPAANYRKVGEEVTS